MAYDNEYNRALARRLTRRLGKDWVRRAKMPDPEYTPDLFRCWLRARRDKSAARRGVFPVRGTGWVFVPAL